MPQLAKIETKKVNLIELIKNSVSLDEEEKKEWILIAKKAGKDKQRELAKILLDEQDRVTGINKKEITEKNKITKQYLHKVDNIKVKVIKKARQAEEKKSNHVDQKQMDDLLNTL